MDLGALRVVYLKIVEGSYYFFFYPRYQGSRGVWKKLEEICRTVGVTITPGSPRYYYY